MRSSIAHMDLDANLSIKAMMYPTRMTTITLQAPHLHPRLNPLRVPLFKIKERILQRELSQLT